MFGHFFRTFRCVRVNIDQLAGALKQPGFAILAVNRPFGSSLPSSLYTAWPALQLEKFRRHHRAVAQCIMPASCSTPCLFSFTLQYDPGSCFRQSKHPVIEMTGVGIGSQRDLEAPCWRKSTGRWRPAITGGRRDGCSLKPI